MAQFEPKDEYNIVDESENNCQSPKSAKTSTGLLAFVYVLVGIVILMSKLIRLNNIKNF